MDAGLVAPFRLLPSIFSSPSTRCCSSSGRLCTHTQPGLESSRPDANEALTQLQTAEQGAKLSAALRAHSARSRSCAEPGAGQAPIVGSPRPTTPSQGAVPPPQLHPPPAVSSASSQPVHCRAERRVAPDGFSAPCPHCSHVTSVRDKRGAGGAPGQLPTHTPPRIQTGGRKQEAGSAALTAPPPRAPKPCSVSSPPPHALHSSTTAASTAQHAGLQPGMPLTSRKRSSSIS